MSAHHVYVGLGANVGDAVSTVNRALLALDGLGLVRRRSSLYRTRPWGKTDQPAFVNAVALLETKLEPRVLLAAFKTIETRLGRVAGERWGPRVIDLDILTYDDREIAEAGLRVPHPRLCERAFVLVPLAEIDPRYESFRRTLAADELVGVERIEA